MQLRNIIGIHKSKNSHDKPLKFYRSIFQHEYSTIEYECGYIVGHSLRFDFYKYFTSQSQSQSPVININRTK